MWKPLAIILVMEMLRSSMHELDLALWSIFWDIVVFVISCSMNKHFGQLAIIYILFMTLCSAFDFYFPACFGITVIVNPRIVL